MPTREKGFCVDNVRVVKMVGGSLSGSKVVRGMAFGKESEGTIKHATSAKVAVFTCALDIVRTETEGTALIKNADETTSGKEEHLAKIIKEIAASGITVIIAGSSVSDLALQYLNRHSIAVLKVPSKSELRRICRVVNATPVERMGTLTPEEVGWVDVYETVEFDGDHMTVLRQLVAGDPGFEKSGKRGDGKGDKTPTATVVLRGSTANDLDSLESAIDDGMSLIRSLLRDRRLVPGAGATELELAQRLDVYGGKMKGQQRHVTKRFAAALEVIPRTLAENAAGEGNKVVNRRFRGNEATEPSDGTIIADSKSLPYPVLDSLAVKRCAIKFAKEAAVSVLTIDSSIMSGGVGIPRRLTINFNFYTSPLSTYDTIVLMFLGALLGYTATGRNVVSDFSSYFSK
jgi:T-complex protein 1 subunit theta